MKPLHKSLDPLEQGTWWRKDAEERELSLTNGTQEPVLVALVEMPPGKSEGGQDVRRVEHLHMEILEANTPEIAGMKRRKHTLQPGETLALIPDECSLNTIDRTVSTSKVSDFCPLRCSTFNLMNRTQDMAHMKVVRDGHKKLSFTIVESPNEFK